MSTLTSTLRIEDSPMNGFLWRVVIFTVGGMFVDGYILGQTGIALSIAAPQLGLDALWLGAVAASSLLGILVGAPLLGRLSDRVGRQRLLAIDLGVIVVLALLHFVIADQVSLLILRFLMGLAIGAEYAIGAALLSEVAPRRRRGVLLGLLNAGWILGFVVAFVVGFTIREAGGSWQLIFASTAVPALIVLLLRTGSPESPRWLLTRGRVDEAKAVVARSYGSAYGIDGLQDDGLPSNTSLAALFAHGYRSRTLFAGLFWACQVVPLFALTIFLPQVFETLGISGEFGAEMFVNGMLLVGAVVGLVAIRLFSRRFFTIWSFAVVALMLVLMALSGMLPPVVSLAAFAVFVLVGSAASDLEYVYPSEIFPTEIRATGVGFATAVSRVGAAISTFLLPVALDTLGGLTTMLILAGVAALGFLISVIWAPETKGLALNEAALLKAATR